MYTTPASTTETRPPGPRASSERRVLMTFGYASGRPSKGELFYARRCIETERHGAQQGLGLSLGGRSDPLLRSGGREGPQSPTAGRRWPLRRPLGDHSLRDVRLAALKHALRFRSTILA